MRDARLAMIDRSALVAYMRRWGLTSDGAVLYTRAACVALVRKGADRAVLKVARHGSDEENAAAVLAHYDGHGAVRLLAHDSGALLLECATPGFAVTERVLAGADDEAMYIICDVMAALHRLDARDSREGERAGWRGRGFRTVEDWGEGFTRYSPGAPHPVLPSELVDQAETLYHELCESQGTRFLLHGDLHHDNVLYDRDRGWLAIDPKGVIGELAYETGAALRNPKDPSLCADPAIIDRRSRIICERLDLDRARVLGWCFAQAVLSALWSVEDGDEVDAITNSIRVAEATRVLLRSL